MASKAIREAIVRAFHEQHLQYAEIAELFAVGQATVNRVLRLYRETGSVEPRPRGGQRKRVVEIKATTVRTCPAS